MYQSVGRFLSEQSKEASYGDGYIDSLSAYIQEHLPGIKGFNRRGLYRMKQFYELYEGNEKVSALLTQLSWTNHLMIMSSYKSEEEREFYMLLAINERYSSRELERQMDSGYYERYMLSKETLLPEKLKSELNPFLDSYVIEFLDLPPKFKEKHLKKGLIEGMKKFILELGKDFTYVDEEHTIMIGGEDFHVDLLLYHRELRCLVAMELKTGKFKPVCFFCQPISRQFHLPHKLLSQNPTYRRSRNELRFTVSYFIFLRHLSKRISIFSYLQRKESTLASSISPESTLLKSIAY